MLTSNRGFASDAVDGLAFGVRLAAGRAPARSGITSYLPDLYSQTVSNGRGGLQLYQGVSAYTLQRSQAWPVLEDFSRRRRTALLNSSGWRSFGFCLFSAGSWGCSPFDMAVAVVAAAWTVISVWRLPNGGCQTG